MKKKGSRGRPRKQQQVATPVMSETDDGEQTVALAAEENANEEGIITTIAQVRIFGFYLTFKFASKFHFPNKPSVLKHSNF